jgi:thiol-disulfide isomerase/thioredoxin
MKSLMKNLALFFVLAIAFSALVGCGGASGNGSSSGGGGGDKAAGEANNANASKETSSSSSTSSKSSDYPQVPTSIMQAEYKGLDGATVKLEDYKGKVLLLNLWATWCGPCRKEMPHLVEMQNQYKDKGFEVIGLNTDPDEDSEEKVKKFAEEMNLNYTLAWTAKKEYAELLKISKFNAIPQSFLVNREGQLLGIYTGGDLATIMKLKDHVAKTVNE